jgi:hypothetical protein
MEHCNVLRGKLIAMSTYIKSTEKYQMNELMLHLKFLEKQEQDNPKRSRKRDIIKLWAKTNKIETNKTV